MKSWFGKNKSAVKGGTKGSFYRRSLFIILLITSIPGLITGFSIHWFAVGQIEQDLKALHQKQIEQRVKTLDDQLTYLELSLAHWAFDPRFNSGLKESDFAFRFKDTRDLIKSLLVMRGSHPLIDDVMLYLNQPSATLFDPEYTPVSDLETERRFNSLLSRPHNIFWNSQPSDVSLVHKIPGGAKEHFGVLTVSLKQDKLLDLLQALTPYNEGTTLLLNAEHETILSAGRDDETGTFSQALLEDVSSIGAMSGGFVKQWQGHTYSVSYGTFKRLNHEWMYVSASPMSVITSPIIIASKIIVLISALVLLAALILSWLASRKIYSPVERFVHLLTGGQAGELQNHGMDEFKLFEKQWHHLNRESKSLQMQLEEELPRIKEGFLMQLIQGHLYAYSERDLRERMKGYGWIVTGRQFTLMSVQLTGFSGLGDRFSSDDEGLVSFAAANIMEELATEHLEQFNVLNFQNLSVGLFLILPQDLPVKAVTDKLSGALTGAINSILKLKVKITISRPTMYVKSIPDLFLSVTQAAGYRLFRDENQIIYMEELLPQDPEHQRPYPFALDREILQAIRMGEQETVEQLIDRFLEEISREQGKEYFVQQSVLQLFGSIHYIVLQSGLQPEQLFGGQNRFEQLLHIRELPELSRWFKEEVIRPYMRQMEERSNLQLKRVVEQTIQYLQTHYMKDISLDSCADMAGTNPYTLSKAFKQIAGLNFIDYLTRIRIDRAKELLRTTNMKINDVSGQVGYQHSYFNRIFKKYEGVTPSQYRDKWLAG
ncbi:AraC family transcriptional regulator [Paenibacillus tarimensis]